MTCLQRSWRAGGAPYGSLVVTTRTSGAVLQSFLTFPRTPQKPKFLFLKFVSKLKHHTHEKAFVFPQCIIFAMITYHWVTARACLCQWDVFFFLFSSLSSLHYLLPFFSFCVASPLQKDDYIVCACMPSLIFIFFYCYSKRYFNFIKFSILSPPPPLLLLWEIYIPLFPGKRR